MPSINILSRELSELIAAGEVIERPASVIKELVENSIDAGAKHITVEIKRGGTTYMRITDDGCGISYEDVPKAFLRHATSKIMTEKDLSSIMTLGFRGEALASVCAVSRTEIMTKPPGEEFGTHYKIEGSQETEYEKIGCPDGTTVMIRDLFYNVPARQKFMKKDTSEGNVVCSIVSKIALSHPDISIKLIRDNKPEFVTPGDGKLYSSVFSVYGRQYAGDLIKVDYEMNSIKISGLCVKPLYSKSNRIYQDFFVNGRYIKSHVCSGALEEAYRGLIMTGKFPACVLKIDISPDVVDVNVHPAKVEIKFSEDKPVYECIYFAVKSALMNSGLVYDFALKSPDSSNTGSQCEEFVQPQLTGCDEQSHRVDNIQNPPVPEKAETKDCVCGAPKIHDEVKVAQISVRKEHQDSADNMTSKVSADVQGSSRQKAYDSNYSKTENIKPVIQTASDTTTSAKQANENRSIALAAVQMSAVSGVIKPPVIKPPVITQEEKYSYINESSFEKKPEPVKPESAETAAAGEKKIRYIGEAFKGYIIAEADNKIIIIDKHAAHERILFEKLRSERNDPASQLLISPCGMLMSLDEAQALQENQEVLIDMGFELDCSANPYVTVKAVPTIIAELDFEAVVHEIAGNLCSNKHSPEPAVIDDILHTIACKAAIKANDINNAVELQKLAEDVYTNDKIRHCPHGRPVMFIISKYELEKQFKRIV
ncbi:MAG: DNA mismatch repair endonuclease MutL [Oscillospiraceae bacterium]|nr:DNA mismatch repair endonuclease MutL [Oscillospiraceae bacterium]